jgi:hypothetical protein
MRALLVIALAFLAAGMLMITGCDLDETRGSGATQKHASENKHDKRDEADRAWDEATNEEPPPPQEPPPPAAVCPPSPPPGLPVCPDGGPPTNCVEYGGGTAWGC